MFSLIPNTNKYYVDFNSIFIIPTSVVPTQLFTLFLCLNIIKIIAYIIMSITKNYCFFISYSET